MRLMDRVHERVREWRVTVERVIETQSSVVAFGRRGNRPVVLKVVRRRGDEWRGGEILNAFNGSGVARVYEYTEGAVLLERLDPGTALAELSMGGRDDEATEILAGVIQSMSRSRGPIEAVTTVEDWGRGFAWYLTSGDAQISKSLVEQAGQLYVALCASQRGVGLLHGDLQHYNVLLDANRGWTAIDPKGVAGEIEYEIGASLRNPVEKPELFASPAAVDRRIRLYEAGLKIDYGRALAWGFAQAVLSAIWGVEDGFPIDGKSPPIMLANAIRPMLE